MHAKYYYCNNNNKNTYYYYSTGVVVTAVKFIRSVRTIVVLVTTTPIVNASRSVVASELIVSAFGRQ